MSRYPQLTHGPGGSELRCKPHATPVLITGGGPCGLMLANELGRRGIRCLVVDTKPDTAFNPQANATQARTMEHFRRLGFAHEIRALGRHPWRPPHLHFMIEAPGYQRLITHVFRGDGPYLDSDAVFGIRSTLVADWERHQGNGPAEPAVYYTLEYDFVPNPEPGTGCVMGWPIQPYPPPEGHMVTELTNRAY